MKLYNIDGVFVVAASLEEAKLAFPDSPIDVEAICPVDVVILDGKVYFFE